MTSRAVGARAALVSLIVAAAIVLTGPAGSAAAADFGAAPVTGVTLTPGVIADAGTGRVDFTWVAPADAAPGDTFSITLPDRLEPAGTREIQLVDATSGEVAVLGSWSGKTATFTFQAYLATHTDVSGTGYFSVKWDQSVVEEGAQTFDDLEIAGHGVGPITKPAATATPAVTTRAAGKVGQWTDSTQTSFTWILAFPGSTTESLTGPVELTDSAPADPGYAFDCDDAYLRVDTGSYPAPAGQRAFYEPEAGPGVTSYTCTASSFALTLDGIPQGEFYTYVVPITGAAPDRDSFANSARFTWPAVQGAPIERSAELRRDDSGGTVIGEEDEGTVCVGDYVWVDANRNGVQDAGEAGIPGVVVMLLAVDAQGNATAVLSGGTPVTATTNGSGRYTFCGLPPLQAGEKYRTAVDKGQSALRAYTPTVSGRGTPSTDSSAVAGFADSFADLTVAGASDLSLDYGYFLTSAPTPADSSNTPELAESGANGLTGPLAAFGVLVFFAGVGMMRLARVRTR